MRKRFYDNLDGDGVHLFHPDYPQGERVICGMVTFENFEVDEQTVTCPQCARIIIASRGVKVKYSGYKE